jgi:excisionase family DNA binding protein
VADEVIKRSMRVSMVARLIGCNKSTIHRLIDQGTLRGFKIGHLKFIYVESIIEYQKNADFVADDIS